MEPFALKQAVDQLKRSTPLIHCITNYVTANDCANALLAMGASPIISDEPADVADISSICDALVLNIGTLNARSVEAMRIAGARSAEMGHPIVLDPVGAGASALRTSTASALLDELPVAVVRGNMSEVKALAGASASTRGVDVNPEDVVTEDNLAASARFARSLAERTGGVVAVTGAIDIVGDARRAFAVRNGTPFMGRITGAGCVLTCLVAAFVAANPEVPLEAAVAAVAVEGLAGQQAEAHMAAADGNLTFRGYLVDALFNMTGDALEKGALVERVL